LIVEYDKKPRNENIFSKKIRAGRRRTYFFDVRTTKADDYYLTITESKKRQNDDGYERHKVFLYKEDFNKFLEELTDVINYVKERMPDFDFDSFSHKYDDDDESGQDNYQPRRTESFSDSRKESHAEAVNETTRDEAEKMEDESPAEDSPSDNSDSMPPKVDPTINEDDLKL
jgi:hypothetical protein